jgi:hypothetical protein
MLKRLSLTAAALVLACACASTTTPAPSPGAATPGAAPAAPAAGPVTTLNMAASTSWLSEDGLIPDQPKLVLVSAGGNADNSAGFALSCNPDNGSITGRLGKQDATRAGKSAIYRLKTGKATVELDGRQYRFRLPDRNENRARYRHQHHRDGCDQRRRRAVGLRGRSQRSGSGEVCRLAEELRCANGQLPRLLQPKIGLLRSELKRPGVMSAGPSCLRLALCPIAAAEQQPVRRRLHGRG